MSDFIENSDRCVIDFDDLQMRGVSCEFLTRISEVFVEEVTSQILVLETALEQQNFTELQKAGHTIKGIASNIAAYRLSDSARIIEEVGLSKKINIAISEVPILKMEFENAVSALSKFCN